MVVLLRIYEEEDEAYQDLVTVATTFFQYLLQPFRDMRELACLYKMEILVDTQRRIFGSSWLYLGFGKFSKPNSKLHPLYIFPLAFKYLT